MSAVGSDDLQPTAIVGLPDDLQLITLADHSDTAVVSPRAEPQVQGTRVDYYVRARGWGRRGRRSRSGTSCHNGQYQRYVIEGTKVKSTPHELAVVQAVSSSARTAVR